MKTSLILLLAALQIADGVVTFYALHSGLAMEANPVAAMAMGYLGFVQAIVMFKSFGLAFTCWLYAERRKNIPVWALAICCSAIALVLTNNYLVVMK